MGPGFLSGFYELRRIRRMSAIMEVGALKALGKFVWFYNERLVKKVPGVKKHEWTFNSNCFFLKMDQTWYMEMYRQDSVFGPISYVCVVVSKHLKQIEDVKNQGHLKMPIQKAIDLSFYL